MNSYVFVTAFFDIDRDNIDIISKDNEKFLHNFEQWARLRNKLIVYTQPRFKERILDIRAKFGHSPENTIVIEVEDFFNIESELFERYKRIADSKALENFKALRETKAANNPQYLYLITMKYWFVMDACRRGLIDDCAAYLDFGYGHGDFVANPEEFDFEWKGDFERKIVLFTLRPVDDVPFYEVVRCSLNYVMGFMVLAPKEYCNALWEHVREAAYMMTAMDFIDDDQTVLLLAYRNHKECYQIVQSDWFMPPVVFGGRRLTLTKDLQTNQPTVKLPSNPLLRKWKLERKGIYKLVDTWRKFKSRNDKPADVVLSDKIARDCAERTYKEVYNLYLNRSK